MTTTTTDPAWILTETAAKKAILAAIVHKKSGNAVMLADAKARFFSWAKALERAASTPDQHAAIRRLYADYDKLVMISRS